MANSKDSGTTRQERREQHRPEQNEGHDEAVSQSGPVLPDDTDNVSSLPAQPLDERGARDQNDIDERETQRAIASVRRQEHSAD
jgi:hypothetical protein